MSIIPADLYTVGRSSFAIERRCSFLAPSAQGDVIASSQGMTAPGTAGGQYYVFAAAAEGAEAGFTTQPIAMKQADGSDEVISTELLINGFYAAGKQLDEFTLTDGTNSIRFKGESNDYNANILYRASLGGVTTSGKACWLWSYTALYAGVRGAGASPFVRFNLRFRVDKDRGEISVWQGDQLKGVAALAGLGNLGLCTWKYTHKPVTLWSNTAQIKEIGVRVEL